MKMILTILWAFALGGCASVAYVDRDPGPLKSPPANRSPRALFFGESFKAYDYFEDARRHPFRPGAPAFDPADAWWLAECSLLVYVPDKRFIHDALARAGFDDIYVFDGAGPALGPDTQFFVASRPDCVIVSFRGSQPNLADWATNARLARKPFGGGSVHGGFLAALDEAWEAGGLGGQLGRLRARSPGRPVWFTGHSLGGALAVLAAARWFGDNPCATGGVYTFGCPRVGDPAFCAAIRFPLWRVVHDADYFTTLPRGDYADAGALQWLDAAGGLHEERGPRPHGFLYNTKTFCISLAHGRWRWLPRDVAGHSPLYYAIFMNNALYGGQSGPGGPNASTRQ